MEKERGVRAAEENQEVVLPAGGTIRRDQSPKVVEEVEVGVQVVLVVYCRAKLTSGVHLVVGRMMKEVDHQIVTTKITMTIKCFNSARLLLPHTTTSTSTSTSSSSSSRGESIKEKVYART